MASRASRRRVSSKIPSLSAAFQRLSVPEASRPVLQATFEAMCRLHDSGRDHIWGYYVRNLARPMWLALRANRVDVLIGNPPWLAYRHMPPDMQEAFRTMSESRGLWAGADTATSQDLSGLFVARAAQLYLRHGGRLAMVMPNAALDRMHYAGFRSGDYTDPVEPLMLKFERSWDLRRIRPHFFPRAACVVFGERATSASEMPADAEIWSGRVPGEHVSWAAVEGTLVRKFGNLVRDTGKALSPYDPLFTQGAILAPRVLFIVSRKKSMPLRLPAGKTAVVSSRSATERKPWNTLTALEGVLESEFVRPVLSGENLLPYRTTEPLLAVLPCTATQALSERGQLENYPDLATWWSNAEGVWLAQRSSERFSLFDQLNYQNKFAKQLPIAPLRVVYNASGMHVLAAKVTDRRAIIASGLYWWLR